MSAIDSVFLGVPEANQSEHFILCSGVGAGWLPLVEATTKSIVTLDPAARFTQIKEKFGSLRIYVDSTDPRTQQIVDVVERLSHFICESCGETGRLFVKGGWYRTYCSMCADESGFKEVPSEDPGNSVGNSGSDAV